VTSIIIVIMMWPAAKLIGEFTDLHVHLSWPKVKLVQTAGIIRKKLTILLQKHFPKIYTVVYLTNI